jgi:hypothetical protein
LTQNNRVVDSDPFIDTTNGEVVSTEEIIPRSALEARLQGLKNSESTLPIHEQMLDAANNPPNILSALTDAYYGLPPRKFEEFLNTEVQILGAIIYQHGPYKGKDGLDHPEGYYQVKLLSLNEKGDPLIIVTGSQGVAMHMFHAMKAHGWWLFDEPQTYRFRKGEKAHFMENVRHDLKKLLAPPKVEAKK